MHQEPLPSLPPSQEEIAALLASWQRCWTGLQAQGDGNALFEQLLACYSQPHRAYHSVQHLSECMAGFASAWQLAERPHGVAMALWFHDAVYDVKRSDNEEKSAAWAEQALLEAGVDAAAAGRVRDLVLATRHTTEPLSILPDAQLLVDIDLAILGADAARFAEYEAQIRTEYQHVPGFIFGYKRKAILQSFLQRQTIYATPHFYNRLEVRARSNLRHAVGQSSD